MDWDKLRVFHAVALAGSFTKATETLNISQSAVSRHICILEEKLGTPLFLRVARGLVLTEAGEALHKTVANVFSKLATAEGIIAEFKDYPYGHIQVATSLSFGSLWLAPRLQEFLDQYPEISIKLFLKDEEVDLHMREADIGITTLVVNHTDVVQSAPLPYRFRIYASRSYLEKNGTPQTPKDLDHHRLITFGREMPHLYRHFDWLTTVGTEKPRDPYLVMNSDQAIYEAARSGVGIAALHKYVVGNDPDLVEILPQIIGPVVNYYVVYPKQLENLKRMKVFIEFLLTKMAEEEQ
jgi:DNA-binding transcriptional LysR family regulator